jgi:hypothetical protein
VSKKRGAELGGCSRRAVRVAAALAGWLALSMVPAPAAPIEAKRGDIAWVHGGIGEDDRAAMAQIGTQYNLRLTFAYKGSGAYLADVQVSIRTASGQGIIETTASGPWLYARLPVGEYVIAATQNGQTLTQRISIEGSARREWVFRFDAPAMQP